MAHEWLTVYTPEIAEAICQNLESLAMPLTLAAEAEGVHRAQVYVWMNENAAFSKQVTQARARGAKKLTELSLDGGKGSAAALWHLERRFREEYVAPKESDKGEGVTIIVEGGLPKRA